MNTLFNLDEIDKHEHVHEQCKRCANCIHSYNYKKYCSLKLSKRADCGFKRIKAKATACPKFIKRETFKSWHKK